MDPPMAISTPGHRRVAERDRKRAARACDGCRRQKEKCDGGVPCRRCTRLRKQCEFLGTPARHPDHPRSGYPGKLDRHDGPARFAELSRRARYLETLLTHYYPGNLSLDTENLRVLAESIDRENPRVSDEVALGEESDDSEPPTDNFITVQPLDNNITHYSGEFSHWNFSMRLKQWIEHCTPIPSRQDGSDDPKIREYYRAEELQSPTDSVAYLSSLPPRYVAEFLIQAFFKHAQTNYFYIDQGWLMDKVNMAYSNSAMFTRRDVGTVCIILITLAIGTQYAYLDSQTPENRERDLTDADAFSEDAVGVMFYRQACSLVPDVITIASLESVQACLLIGIYTLPLDPSGLSYIYLNLAVKLAIQNGMHRKYPGEGLDPVVNETRSRVWWTTYTTERRVGIFHGRPTSIVSSDMDAEMPLNRPDLFRGGSTTDIEAMLATLSLHQILGTISREMSHTGHDVVAALNRLVELNKDLHKWWESLPEAAMHKPKSAMTFMSRSDAHIKLEYCLIRMFAGRPFIELRPPTRSNSSISSSSADAAQRSGSARKAELKALLVADCVAAALEVIDICTLLRSGIGLARASYTEFSSCRAAILIILTQCLEESSDRLRQSLRDGMAMIKIMSAGGESARSDASILEAFERAITRLDIGKETNTSQNESDYTRFKRWETLWKTDPPTVHFEDSVSPTQTSGFGLGVGSTGLERVCTAPVQQAGTPFGGIDWNFASFPQSMSEFSSMFGHGFMSGLDDLAGHGHGSAGH